MNEFGLVDSDIEMLRAARSDPDAFGDFYGRHAVAVERWIRAQTPDMATAADLTAETFAQALVSLDRFRGATDESARAWLYGIARNLGIHEIDNRAVAGRDALSSIPSCSSIPPGWKGEWVQISGLSTGNTGTTVYSNFAPGTWHLVFCVAVSPGYTGLGNTGNTGAG